MSISDVVSGLGIAVYPIIGLILFMSVFVGVLLRVTSRGRGTELDRAALLPLADESRSHSPRPPSVPEFRP